MNCDQVFAILTRGPFPSGEATDHSVEAHLAVCSECRHFADALRPDGSTDSETLVPEESRGLPYYWGVAALPGGEAIVSTAIEGRNRSQRKRKTSLFQKKEPIAHLSGWQLAFAVLMGATLGTLLRFLGYADGSSNEQPLARVTAPVRTVDNRITPPLNANSQILSKLGATPACLEQRLPGFANHDSQYESSRYGDSSLKVQTAGTVCCTECHNSTSPRLALRSTTAKIVRSCQVCHKDVPLEESRR